MNNLFQTTVPKILLLCFGLVTNESIATPIFQFAKDGIISGVQAELENGVNPNLVDTDYEWTVLEFAISGGHKDIVELLLKSGAVLTVSDPLHQAVEFGEKDILEFLINKGGDVNTAYDDGYTILHAAVSVPEPEIAKLLIEMGANIEPTEKNGYTPLHYAAFYGFVDIAEILLSKGANPEAKSNAGKTPIDEAENNGYKKVAQLLRDSINSETPNNSNNPSVFVNNDYSNGKDVTVTESSFIKITTTFDAGEIFYTLDGTKPTFTSTPYTAPFKLTEATTIRAVAYSSDFTEFLEAEPVKLNILKTYSLKVLDPGVGQFSIDPHGPYTEGTKVTLTAKPEGDWKFIKWEGASNSTESSITITMDGDKTIKPIFGTNVKVNVIGEGKVIQTPTNPVAYGSTVSFKAEPDDRNYFFRWAGELSGNGNPTQLQVLKSNPVVSGLFAEAILSNILKFEVKEETISVVGCDKNAFGELVIPSSYNGKTITAIGKSAFFMCRSLTSVTIPDSVISLGDHAFNGCSNLENVTIGNSVTRILRATFAGCSKLKNVIIPNSVTSIEDYAFAYCDSLKSAKIGNSVTSIEHHAFNDCKSLTSIEIPASVTSIGYSAFGHCISLERMNFLGNAPFIHSGAFQNINAKIFVYSDGKGFGKSVGGLPFQIIDRPLVIKSFNIHAYPFSLAFESKPGSTYKIEAAHDLKYWVEIGEVQGTGATVNFTDWREAIFGKQYYRVKIME